MNIKKELIKREIAGDTVLVPVGHTVYEANGLFILNEAGAFLWDILPNAQDEAALVAQLLEEYDVDPQTAATDVAAFLQKLQTMGIID